MLKWLRRKASGTPDSDQVNSSSWNPSGWWWCMEHNRVENPPDSPGHRRLGPYPTAADAENWRDDVDRRNDKWDEEDRRWAGDR